jgi:predicted GNAT family acetyltransferase
MSTDLDGLVVRNDEKAQQFRLEVDGQVALIQYARSNGTILFSHTEVPPALEGKGLAAKLARTALEYARDHKLAVVPRCQYVASYIRKHPEFEPLVKKDARS